MTLIILRSIIGFFEEFSGLFAALIFLGYDPKAVWRKTLVYGLLLAGLCNLTYFIPIDGIRHPVNWALFFIVYKSVFRHRWWECVKSVVTATLIFSLIPGLVGQFFIEWIWGAPQLMSVRFWVIAALVMPPLFSSMIFLAFLLRRVGTKWAMILTRIKNNPQDLKLFAAIILQLWLLFLCLDASIFSKGALWKSIALLVAWGVVMGLNFFIIYTAVRSRERKIINSAKDLISGNVTDLLNSVRSQRHDFINHLQVITALHSSEQKEKLGEYLSGLNAEASFYNQVLKVDNPFVAALLNAKMARADTGRIRLETEVNANLADMKSGILDIVRILGNLLDNAIEAVERQNMEDKWIRLAVRENGPLLFFEVSNPGIIETETAEKMFQPGFTTKGQAHAGLGLYSALELARKLGGHIIFTSEASHIKFSLIIPR